MLSTLTDRVPRATYAVALVVSISVWFLAIRAPLWLDETGSFYLISGGFSQIIPRQWPSIPAYSFILWFSSKIFGTSEIALRVPEILAMLGAVYLLYRAARELFDQDVAIIAAVIFCLHPIVVFAAIDVRPYAFAALTINAAILCLLRLRRSNSNWLAALFGFLAAFVIYFRILSGVLLPALVIGFFIVKNADKNDDSRALWRQFGVALAAFALAFLLVIPELLSAFHTSGAHVFDEAPKLEGLGSTLAPGRLALIFLGAAFVAAIARRLELPSRSGWRILLCASLGLVPILILYGVSAETSIHIFVSRYRLVAIPGIALCWAFLVSIIHSRAIRMLFCVVLVATTAYQAFTSPASKYHGYTWKYALEFAEKNGSADGAPVLICSDFPESNFGPPPVGPAVKEGQGFPPLSYYKLSGPVVLLPRAMNDDAIRVASNFLQDGANRKKRFLALGYIASYGTLRWLSDHASETHEVRQLAKSYGIVILEFIPRSQSDSRESLHP